MRILSIPSYCYPEIVASSHLDHDVYEAVAQANHEMIIHTPAPCRGIDPETREKYKKIRKEELMDGHIKIHRFGMYPEGRNVLARALRYFLINLIQYCKGVGTNGVDVIYGCSTPPTQGMICAWVKKALGTKRKVAFVYNLQDVFPDSLVTTGLTKKGSFLWKLGRRIEDYTYRNADAIIVISESIKNNIMDKGVPAEKIRVISNWIDTQAVRPVAKKENTLFEEFSIDREKFTVVYAGNLGEAQGAGVILDAAKRLPDVQFVIFGGGAGYEEAVRREKDIPNVIINGLQPQEKVPQVYSLGDLALITCKKGAGASAMPSKTWSIMACATPIVAAFDTDSELAQILEKANAGICVEPEDADALAEGILQARASMEKYNGGRTYVCENASKEVCVAGYLQTMTNAMQ